VIEVIQWQRCQLQLRGKWQFIPGSATHEKAATAYLKVPAQGSLSPLPPGIEQLDLPSHNAFMAGRALDKEHAVLAHVAAFNPRFWASATQVVVSLRP
jgi:hypothetical protein